MQYAVQEIGFDLVITVASGLSLAAYMLGVLLDPLPAAALSVVMIIAGSVVILPRRVWSIACVLGITTVILAGVVVPRLVAEFTTINDVMPLTVGLSAIVLFSTFVAVHLTAFQPRPPRVV